MAMTTRFRVKKQGEFMIAENAAKSKMIDPKVTSTKVFEEKRRALGDIHNKQAIITDSNKNGTLQSEKDRKSILSNVVYKDIKPRVDTRWRKNETSVTAAAAHKPAGNTKSFPTMTAITRPLSRQSSKGSDIVKKEKTVKSITESIASHIKKTTTITSCIDLKKDQKKKNEIFSSIIVDMPFIRSPQSMKMKEKTPTEKFFESHSTHLLHQVDNIDEKDKNNIQMISEYANDIYAYLMRLENIYAIRSNFLENQMDVTPKMRSVLLDWINEVHHQFNLEVETFHMTVSMIDRYLQSTSSTPRKHLQLVGVTALFMASKYEEMMPPEINDFVYVTDDTYSKRQILQMEMKIFKALDFNLCKPLPIHFLRRYMKAAGSSNERQYLASKYFIELASIDYELTSCKPSEIAAASLYLALYIMNKMKNDNDLWTPNLQYYSTYSVKQLMPIVKRLAVIVSSAQDVKLRAIFVKYSNGANFFTSTLPEMTGLKIQELIQRTP